MPESPAASVPPTHLLFGVVNGKAIGPVVMDTERAEESMRALADMAHEAAEPGTTGWDAYLWEREVIHERDRLRADLLFALELLGALGVDRSRFPADLVEQADREATTYG